MTQNPVRILHVITGMGSGGAEMFLMNMYRNMDHDRVVFDFVLQSDENIYRDELLSYGSKIYRIEPYFKHYFKNHAQLKEILRSGYSIVHVHGNALLYITPLLYAKRMGIPCRIMHSHNTSMYYKWALPYHVLNKHRLRHAASHRFACSDAAGKWMFFDDFTVIENAIDLDAFSFREESRIRVREELGIPQNAFVIGQVGRLTAVKNQQFSMKVFSEVHLSRPDSRLLFIGTGSMEKEMKEIASSMGIGEKVLFLGARKDVSRLQNAMDLFIFPSLYEGLGIVAIEAQANGLPVYCSNAIPDEALIGENIHRLSLEAGVDAWAKEILQADLNRRDNQDRLREAGYDIRYEAKKLQEFYLSVGNRE